MSDSADIKQLGLNGRIVRCRRRDWTERGDNLPVAGSTYAGFHPNHPQCAAHQARVEQMILRYEAGLNLWTGAPLNEIEFAQTVIDEAMADKMRKGTRNRLKKKNEEAA